MQFHPGKEELTAIAGGDEPTRLHYFLTRVMEAEEVWSLGNARGWLITDDEGAAFVPLWPYAELAADCVAADMADYRPQAVSLEHFVENVLPMMRQQNLLAAVFPTPSTAGVRLPAAGLLSHLESLMDAGDYFLEG